MSTENTFDDTSAELTQVDGAGHDPLPPTTQGGRVRVAQFSKTTTVAPSDADTLELVRLPKGAVILSGAVTWTDQDTGAGTLDIGTDDGTADADAIASALDISAAGSSALPEATAFTPIVLDAPTSVFATYNEGTALAVGTIAGYLLYVVNT